MHGKESTYSYESKIQLITQAAKCFLLKSKMIFNQVNASIVMYSGISACILLQDDMLIARGMILQKIRDNGN